MSDIGEAGKSAKMIFEYLSMRDADCVRADLIIGFGHFDLKIPRTCADLYDKGIATSILFTGGRGSGSADICTAEGIMFADTLRQEYPHIPVSQVFVESASTHTGENIEMSAALLRSLNGDFCFEKGIKSIAAVASPYRQRRVCATMRKMYPDIHVYNLPPKSSFEQEAALFRSKNEDFIRLLTGELDRIESYPQKGYMIYEQIPDKINEARTQLMQLGK